MKVSAKQITSFANPLVRNKKALADHINTIPAICSLSHAISCCVHKPYMGHVTGLWSRMLEKTLSVLEWCVDPCPKPHGVESLKIVFALTPVVLQNSRSCICFQFFSCVLLQMKMLQQVQVRSPKKRAIPLKQSELYYWSVKFPLFWILS